MRITPKLVLALVLTTALIWAVGLYSTASSQRSLRDAIEHKSAGQVSALMNELDRNVDLRIQEWQAFARNPLLLEALRSSNAEFTALTDREARIDAMESRWTDAPASLMDPLMANALAEELRIRLARQNENSGYPVFGEVFVTNRYGANVAQTHRTSDYRQNDETRWREAMSNGLFVGDVGFDESAGIFSIDICVRIDDAGGGFEGVLKAVMNIQEIIELIETRSHAGGSDEQRRLVLLTEDARIIYSAGEVHDPLSDGSPFVAGVDLSDRTQKSSSAGTTN